MKELAGAKAPMMKFIKVCVLHASASDMLMLSARDITCEHAPLTAMLPAGGPAQLQGDRRDLLCKQVSGSCFITLLTLSWLRAWTLVHARPLLTKSPCDSWSPCSHALNPARVARAGLMRWCTLRGARRWARAWRSPCCTTRTTSSVPSTSSRSCASTTSATCVGPPLLLDAFHISAPTRDFVAGDATMPSLCSPKLRRALHANPCGR